MAVRHRLPAATRARQAARLGTRFVSKGLDTVSVGVVGGRLRTNPPRTSAEELTALALAEHLPEVGAALRLRPDYDVEFGSWLLNEMRKVESRGRLVTALVRLPTAGRPVGMCTTYAWAGSAR